MLSLYGYPPVKRLFSGSSGGELQHRWGHHPIKELADEKNSLYSWAAWFRDPAERLHSAYKYLKDGGCNAKDARYAKRHLKGFASFEEAIEKLPNVKRSAHFKTQASYLRGVEKLARDAEVFNHNKLSDSVQDLQKKALLPSGGLPHLNHSPTQALRLPGHLIEKIRCLYIVDYMLLGDNEVSARKWSPKSLFSSPISVVFYDSNYERWYDKWLRSFREENKLTVVPIFLRKKGDDPRLDAVNLAWDGNRKTLWRMRLQVMWSFIASGVDVFHLDVDARVYGDLMSLVEPEVDMAFSQGTITPKKVSKKHGAVACCGAYFMRGKQKTEEFLERAIQLNIRDDQVSINSILFNPKTLKGVTPPRQERESAHRRSMSGIVYSWNSRPISVINGQDRTKAIIWSMDKASRLKDWLLPETVIWHPFLRSAGRFQTIFEKDKKSQIELVKRNAAKEKTAKAAGKPGKNLQGNQPPAGGKQARPVINFKAKGFAFFGAPKNGGTTIRTYLKIASGDYSPQKIAWLQDATKKKYIISKVGSSKWTKHAFKTKKPKKGFHKAFCIYRDPEQRLISCYKDKFILEKRGEAKDLPRFVELLNITWDSRVPPKETLKRSKKSRNIKYLLRHFMPQSFWWVPPQDMDFVLDFKDWQSIRRVWSALLDIELPDIHLRNSAMSSHSSETIRMPPEFNDYLEKIYQSERAYQRRISHGDEHAPLLEAIERAG